jgi:hypothetical protein
MWASKLLGIIGGTLLCSLLDYVGYVTKALHGHLEMHSNTFGMLAIFGDDGTNCCADNYLSHVPKWLLNREGGGPGEAAVCSRDEERI